MSSDTLQIFSVIVTYNPEINNVTKLVNDLKKQKVVPVIIDNGTLDQTNLSTLSALCQVIRLDENFGIAKAQNIGISHVKEMGGKYVLFFDQDSEINDSFVTEIINDYIYISNDIGRDKIAAIGPVFTDSRYGFFYKFIKLDKFGFRTKIDPNGIDKPFEVSLIISSGSLISVNMIDNIGMMDEDLFIDYVDTEWCLRAISKGYKIYAATSAKMSHAIGDKMVKLFIFNIPVHSPTRRYYRIRNAFLLYRMKHVPLSLKIRENVFNIIHQIILIFMQNKYEHFSILIKAIRDGMRFSKGIIR
ncbi:rhamnosyltransferase [Brenneria goodwinii]|uniref:rhamnosyltransferase n=1 Tax=Brenneria goodwinii TaxID=1109412 RepID=UPI001EFC1190|nr:rhamnosyltransferase [Brenneria goodwinii]MCG8158726.1 rhamnosyltransferase [Brenneria goodwinii]MCG8163259.1 rhamnosyltransferase [Brenneria goodwinii]MCG8167680.1 rhamnosyltransferase [Brenneria goodwinii]MCG8170586.1 rhamnosyltransferase [Brenneria goodwinii]MCG8174414.1 rhamnosyltransferase [Brenneria goodwinii]